MEKEKELIDLAKRVEAEINNTPSGSLRNLLTDVNVMILYIMSNKSYAEKDMDNAYDKGIKDAKLK